MKGEQELIDGYLEGELTPDEETRLAEWLSGDRGNVRAFVREAHLHRQLRSILLAQPFHAEAGSPVKKIERTVLLSKLTAAVLALRRAWLPIAACVVPLIGAGIWFFAPTTGLPALAEVHGDGLSILRAGRPLQIVAGMSLESGDVLRTPPDVTAIIGFRPEATRLTLQPETELTLAGMSHGKRFAIRFGKLEASVARQRPFRPMVITTPQAEVRVVGTRFTLAVTASATRLDVTEGKVRFKRKSDATAVKVGAGHYAAAAPNYELAALPLTGTILCEWWRGVKGGTRFSLREHPGFPDHPDGRDKVPNFELSVAATNQLGVRLRGYLHPPVTGDYEFWLNGSFSGSSYAELIMSANEHPSDGVQVAKTGIEGVGATQAPPPIPLVAGRLYYIEIQIVINTKVPEHLAVEWKRPGEPRELLTGEYLSPFKPK